MLEKELILSASGVVANTEELAESFRQKYPAAGARVTTITNGFSESLQERLASFPAYSESSTGTVDLCYFGAVYELRRPTELLQALKELLDSRVPGADRLRIKFTGGWIVEDKDCNRLAEELEKRHAVSREPSQSHENYLRRLKKAQYLLILQQGFPLQIPAKIYEYMASGRPMIMIGGEVATANLINSKGIGEVCPNSVDSIKRMLERLIKAPDQVRGAKEEVIKQFSYASLTTELAAVLDKALSGYTHH